MGTCITKKTKLPSHLSNQDPTNLSNAIINSTESLAEEYLFIGCRPGQFQLPPPVAERLTNSPIFQPVAELYQPDLNHRFTTVIGSDKSIYYGELNQQGVRHGIGKIMWRTGYFIEGIWLDNNATGYFRLIYPNGNMFEGQLKCGKAYGHGTFWCKKSETTGDWKNNSLEGHGDQLFKSGVHYVGEFRDNKYDGYGIIKYPNGARFEGYFEDGKKNGLGRTYWSDSDIMQVMFRDNLVWGLGTCGTINGYFQTISQTPTTITIECQCLEGPTVQFTKPAIYFNE